MTEFPIEYQHCSDESLMEAIKQGRVLAFDALYQRYSKRPMPFMPKLKASVAFLVFLIIVRLLEMWLGTAESKEQRLTQYAGGAIGSRVFLSSR